MTKVCIECGKEFEPSGNNPNHMIYCSVKCGKRYRHRTAVTARLHKVICSECGVEFETPKTNKKCCGPECVYKRQLRLEKEKIAEGKKKRKSEKRRADELLKAKTPKEEAWEIEAEARKRGMNYGMYYAMLQMQKERAALEMMRKAKV